MKKTAPRKASQRSIDLVLIKLSCWLFPTEEPILIPLVERQVPRIVRRTLVPRSLPRDDVSPLFVDLVQVKGRRFRYRQERDCSLDRQR